MRALACLLSAAFPLFSGLSRIFLLSFEKSLHSPHSCVLFQWEKRGWARASSHLQQVSVQDLLAAAGAHVLPAGRNRAGAGGRRAHGRGGRAAGGRVLPLHVGPLRLFVRVRLQEEAAAELRRAGGASGRRRRHLPRSGSPETGAEAHHWRASRVRGAARCARRALMLGGDHLEDSVQSAFITLCLILTRANPREASRRGGSPYLKHPRG